MSLLMIVYNEASKCNTVIILFRGNCKEIKVMMHTKFKTSVASSGIQEGRCGWESAPESFSSEKLFKFS